MNKNRIAIIGHSAEDPEGVALVCDFAIQAAIQGYYILTGGNGYLAKEIRNNLLRQKLGSRLVEIPLTENSNIANDYMRLQCNLGFLRNYLLVASADYVVASGGGAGTLSELAMAWQLHRPICIVGPERGWALVGSWWLDHRNIQKIFHAKTLDAVFNWLKDISQSDQAESYGNELNHQHQVINFFNTNKEWEIISTENESDLRISVPRRVLEGMTFPNGVAIDMGGGAGVDTLFLAKSLLT